MALKIIGVMIKDFFLSSQVTGVEECSVKCSWHRFF